MELASANIFILVAAWTFVCVLLINVLITARRRMVFERI